MTYVSIRVDIGGEDKIPHTLITSHVPDVWTRYEAVGQRVMMGQTDQRGGP